MKNSPKQERAAQRLEEILKATEELVIEMPIEEITPTLIAKRAGITRTSLYHFFPSKFDIFDELTGRYYKAMQEEVVKRINPGYKADYRKTWTGIAGTYSDYFNSNAPAAILILGRKDSKQISFIDGASNEAFASGVMEMMRKHSDLPDKSVHGSPGLDLFQIVVELMKATFSFGMRREGKITPKTQKEAENISLALMDSRLNAKE